VCDISEFKRLEITTPDLFLPSLTTLWVPFDKSEGPVKQKLSLTMREHRFVGHRTLSTKTLESICT
jgi:hypothetical protein